MVARDWPKEKRATFIVAAAPLTRGGENDMVVAETIAETIRVIIMSAFEQVAAPLLGSAAEPARDFIINALPIVFGALGGGGFGIERILF